MEIKNQVQSENQSGNKSKKGIFIKAAIAALMLFLASMYAGYALESDSYSKTENKINELEQGLENSLLFSLFVQTHNQSESMCLVLKDQLDEVAQATYNIYGTLEESKSTSIFRGYEQLRTKYFLANMRFYLMLREYRQVCNDTTQKPILFFYSAYNDCPACVAQGKVLDEVRYECKNARVYAFPSDAESIAMIKAFKSYYKVTGTPSLVIEDKKYDNLMGKDEIKAMIGCPQTG